MIGFLSRKKWSQLKMRVLLPLNPFKLPPHLLLLLLLCTHTSQTKPTPILATIFTKKGTGPMNIFMRKDRQAKNTSTGKWSLPTTILKR